MKDGDVSFGKDVLGTITARPGDTLAPPGTVNRAETATLLQRYFERAE
ncbi:MAG: hypothetical protein LBK57_11640 [Clostridiales Family XIII bacterium]|nr:hypothetical protein [Clostridiales Family XIII bacterium]